MATVLPASTSTVTPPRTARLVLRWRMGSSEWWTGGSGALGVDEAERLLGEVGQGGGREVLRLRESHLEQVRPVVDDAARHQVLAPAHRRQADLDHGVITEPGHLG